MLPRRAGGEKQSHNSTTSQRLTLIHETVLNALGVSSFDARS